MDEKQSQVVIGVRATPGRWVRIQGLSDGWIVSADHKAPSRRWAIGGGLAVILALPIVVLVSNSYPDMGGFVAGVALIAIVLVASIGRSVARGIAAFRNAREIGADTRRAGGVRSMLDGLRAAFGNRKAPSAAGAEQKLRPAGSKDGVVGADQVRMASIGRQRWRTTVQVSLADGGQVSYQVRGVRAPTRLVGIMHAALGSKCKLDA